MRKGFAASRSLVDAHGLYRGSFTSTRIERVGPDHLASFQLTWKRLTASLIERPPGSSANSHDSSKVVLDEVRSALAVKPAQGG